MKWWAVCVILIISGALCWFAIASDSEVTGPVTFIDVTAGSNITFKHDNAATGQRYLIETMGSGAGWIDYDNDGYLDLYLVNSAATKVYKPSHPLRSALYRSNGDGTFTDVTDRAGVVAVDLFGMGVAVGDYDNDGFEDMYVVGYGRSILYHNNGNGTFTDVTEKAGVANLGKWGSSAAWFDYDHDGKLDLIVANYLDFTPERNLICIEQGRPAYCHPNKYPGQTPTLFHNEGNGIFTDVSRASKIGLKPGNGLGVVCFDYNGDGWTDVFLANDSMENFLYLNKGNDTFEEVGMEAGVALGEDGKAEAGMGADAADYDGDGLPDLFVTHLDLEYNRLYRNQGDGTFADTTFPAKLGAGTFRMSGFGTRFVDYDNDGWRDLFIANGHVLDNVQYFHAGTDYAEPKTVYRNVHGAFQNVTKQLGPDLVTPRVSRAAAFADYDNDGDMDVLVTNNGERPQLFRNDGGNRNHWLEVRLIGTRSNRDGIGTKLKIVANDVVQTEEAKGGMSYQAAHDPRLHVGLDKATRVTLLQVYWPSGAVTKLTDVPADQCITVKENVGEVPSHFPPFKKTSE
ncbi:MAG: CRTAC1 family protein [Bryobacteraceae bacterium]